MRITAIVVSFCVGMLFIEHVHAQGGRQVSIPTEDSGDKYSLEGTLFLPEGNGPFPVVIFSHGSIANPRQKVWPNTEVTQVFLKNSLAVLHVVRSGFGTSGGRDQETTSKGQPLLPGLGRALKDLESAMAYVKATSVLDSSRVILSGNSRGGILSVLYAAKHSDSAIRAVVNVSGLWTNNNPSFNFSVFKEAGRAIKVPMLWLYSEGDDLQTLESINQYLVYYSGLDGTFDSKTAENVVLKIYPTPAVGHNLSRTPQVWEKDARQFLERLGLPKRKD